MRGKSLLIVIVIIVLLGVATGSYILLEDKSDEQYNWGVSYSVEITAEPDQSYTLILPVPVHVDLQFFNRTSDEDFETKYVNETTADLLSSLRVESGNGTIEIVETERGAGLLVLGTGPITIVAEERGETKEDDAFLDGILGNRMSLMEENGTEMRGDMNFTVRSSTNTTDIGIDMRYRKWLSFKIWDEDGNEVDHANESFWWDFTGIISEEGWTIVPGNFRAVACC